jgi:hypothetical protein
MLIVDVDHDLFDRLQQVAALVAPDQHFWA